MKIMKVKYNYVTYTTHETWSLMEY